MKTQGKNLSLVTLLRVLGVVALLLSGATFLIQGLSALDTFQRYFGFTALTLATAALGLFSGQFLKDPKGARTFFAVVLAAIPALWSQLGGMTLSLSGLVLESTSSNIMPNFFKIPITDPTQFLLALLSGVAVILPTSYLAYQTLDRKFSKQFLSASSFLGALMLLPIRDASGVFIIIIATAITFLYLGSHKNLFNPRFMTFERKASLATLLLPSLIVTLRAAYYTQSTLYNSAAILLIGLFVAVYTTSKRQGINRPDYSYSVSITIISFIVGLHAIPGLNNSILPLAPALSLLASHLLLRICSNRGLLKSNILFDTLWTLYGAWVALGYAANSEFISGVALLILAGIGITEGFSLKRKYLFISGIAFGVLGSIVNLSIALRNIEVMHWVSLGIAGALIIVTSSLIERYGKSATLKLKQVFSEFE